MFKKVKLVIRDQLMMGVTPEKLAQSLVGGILIGMFPLLGACTLLAALAAFTFKLNHVAIQMANYLMYPVQIIMIPIYVKIVSLVFDVGDVPIRPDLILKQFGAGPLQFIKQYSLIGLYAIVLWCFLSAALYFILYPMILKVIIKIKKRKQ